MFLGSTVYTEDPTEKIEVPACSWRFLLDQMRAVQCQLVEAVAIVPGILRPDAEPSIDDLDLVKRIVERVGRETASLLRTVSTAIELKQSALREVRREVAPASCKQKGR